IIKPRFRKPTDRAAQGACLTIDHGQILGPELGLMEMSEVEYTHLQHLIQVHMEAHAAPPDVPDGRSHPDSPVMPTQAIDLSTSTDEHYLVMPGEKTPASHGEVPGFVLARVRGQDSPTELRADCSTSSQMRSRSSARVCLEKRFNSLSADTPRPQDIQSAFFFSPVVCLLIQFYALLFFKDDDVATPAAFKKHGSTHGSRHRRSASAGPGSAGESGSSTSRRPQSHMSLIQRRERHNSKERERRKRIRLYCDELNMLVPFCESDTDKVTTLQWTTAFLGYIKKTYGDTFKEEFQTAFADGKGHFLKSGPSSGPDPIHREMDEILSIPLAVEQ
uniref:BHLH domain-containing protein n=1 Tax=Cyclopterus lumpus TaxID=8103 RepID=A0A8C3A3V9_CYCLU